MPEEPEVELHELQETIEELREEREERAAEKRESAWTRLISLSTALLAVLAAIAALQSGTLVNEAMVKKNDSVLAQAQASDQWNYYQAKGLKGNGAQQTADLLAAAPATAPLAKKYQQQAERYKREQEQIKKDAAKYEQDRDDASKECDAMLKRHHLFAFCVTFTQVAIALSAIAALTKRRPVWLFSLLVGVAGLVWFIDGLIK